MRNEIANFSQEAAIVNREQLKLSIILTQTIYVIELYQLKEYHGDANVVYENLKAFRMNESELRRGKLYNT